MAESGAMLTPIRQTPLLRPLPARAVAAARSRTADLEALLLLALLVLAGVVWMIVGAAVMRGAPESARTGASLQRGLADLQALASN